MRRSHLRFPLGLAAFAAVVVPSMHAHAQMPPPVKRPAYQVQRFNEDWSVVLPAPDWWDPVKFIPLSDDGDIWISFGGSHRLRVESWSNFNFGPANDDTFVLNRSMLHADLHVGPHLRFFAEGKAAFSTDRDLPMGRRTLDADELDLQNGFVDVMAPFLDGDLKLTFRAGRQEMLLGKQRLVSPLDWSNTRRTFDGFSLIAALGDWKITGFWTKPVVIRKYDFNYAESDDLFYGLYATGKVPTTDIGLDLYWLGLENERGNSAAGGGAATINGTAGIERRQTLGGRLFGTFATNFDYDLEGAWQTGDIGPGDIDAYMFSTQVGYKFADAPGKPRVYLGFDYASGDDTTGGDVQTFNQLYPLGHAYLGWLDQIGRQNIIDLNPGVQFAINPKLDFNANVHFFWLASDGDAAYNVGGAPFRTPPYPAGTSDDIGTELDLLVTYRFDAHTTVLVGYSRFWAGDFIDDTTPAAGSEDIDFFYTSIQYTF